MKDLNFLNGWANAGKYFSRRSAQSYLGANQLAFAAAGCGSACGSGDENPQPSACGAGDDGQPKPSACGSGCGAGDNK